MRRLVPRSAHTSRDRPGAVPAIQAPVAAIQNQGRPPQSLRASQINGCSFCADGGVKHAKQAGESDEHLFAVAAWRHAPYFPDPERAALGLSEAMTRLNDREDPVPDQLWTEAVKRRYPGLAPRLSAACS